MRAQDTQMRDRVLRGRENHQPWACEFSPSLFEITQGGNLQYGNE
jgi:hypothetical protein